MSADIVADNIADNVTVDKAPVERHYDENFINEIAQFINTMSYETETIPLFKTDMLESFIQGYCNDVYVKQQVQNSILLNKKELFNKKDANMQKEADEFYAKFIEEHKCESKTKFNFNKVIRQKINRLENKQTLMSKYIIDSFVEQTTPVYNYYTPDKEIKESKIVLKFNNKHDDYDEELNFVISKFFNLLMKITKDTCKSVFNKLMKTLKSDSYVIYTDDKDDSKIKNLELKNKDKFTKLLNDYVSEQYKIYIETPPPQKGDQKLQFAINQNTIANIDKYYELVINFTPIEHEAKTFSLQKFIQCYHDIMKERNENFKVNNQITIYLIKSYLPSIINNCVNMLCTPNKVNINILLENMNKKSIIYDRLSIETCVEDKTEKTKRADAKVKKSNEKSERKTKVEKTKTEKTKASKATKVEKAKVEKKVKKTEKNEKPKSERKTKKTESSKATKVEKVEKAKKTKKLVIEESDPEVEDIEISNSEENIELEE